LRQRALSTGRAESRALGCREPCGEGFLCIPPPVLQETSWLPLLEA
jgi:hypothetical protein